MLFFGIPGASFDFASFSFQVPICGLAKQTVPAAKHIARVSNDVLVFMWPIKTGFRPTVNVFCSSLGENAEAVIMQYQFNPFVSGEKGMVVVEVSKGAFLLTTGRISQLSDKRIEVKTALAGLATTGAEFWAGPMGGDLEGVAVFEGSVEVSNKGGAVALSAKGVTQPRVHPQTQGLGLRSRSSTDPIGTTLTRGQGPSQAVIWPQEKTDRAVDSITFESEIARNSKSKIGSSSAP